MNQLAKEDWSTHLDPDKFPKPEHSRLRLFVSSWICYPAMLHSPCDLNDGRANVEASQLRQRCSSQYRVRTTCYRLHLQITSDPYRRPTIKPPTYDNVVYETSREYAETCKTTSRLTAQPRGVRQPRSFLRPESSRSACSYDNI